MRQLTALDAQFLALEDTETYGHVGSLAILDPSTAPDGALSIADLRRLISQRLHMAPPLTLRLAGVPLGLDRPYWVHDDRFDIAFHVREIALPPPGTDDQLAEQVSRIFARHLDRTRPLWEAYLISGLPGGYLALLTKIHHAAVDGLSGAEILAALYDTEPQGREVPPVGAPPQAEGTDALTMLRHTVTRLPTMPLRVASRLPRLLPYLDVYPSVLGIPGATTFSRLLSHTRNLVTFTRDGQVISRPVLRAPAVSFSGRISSHRVFVFGTQSLADIKKVKNHYGVTVNDVVVSLVSGGVRHWLARHDELLEDPLLAQIPVSVRTEEQRGTFGNRVSVMIVPIPTDVAEPEDRLHRSAQAMSSAKELHGAIPATTLQDVTTFIPPAVHARASRALTSMYQKRLLRPMQNLVISNVPGPPFRLYTAGAELRAYYPVSVIAHGTGLNATVMSYRDDLNIGLIADRYLMPDLRVVLDGMHQELAALLAHC